MKRVLRYTHLVGIMIAIATVELTEKASVKGAIKKLATNKDIKGLFTEFSLASEKDEKGNLIFVNVDPEIITEVYESVKEEAKESSKNKVKSKSEEIKLSKYATLKDLKQVEDKLDLILEKLA